MLKIDSHQHFWKYNDGMSDWITEDMSILRRDFMPDDLAPILKESTIDGCVVVQVNQSLEENIFQLDNAGNHDFIKGVVGWVDLQATNIEEQLMELSRHHKLKGFRHILQGEQDRALMLKPAFLSGVQALAKHNFSYDILIYPDQLEYIPDFLGQFPDQRFVIDHIAKPDIKARNINEWAAGVRGLKSFDNLFCKVSGMVTEANWTSWKPEDFDPYLDVIYETFGAKKLMFGSDWPVCMVAGEYKDVVSIAQNYVSKLTADEQSLFWADNAIDFYNLN
ncbi:amidohydrolase family protein [Pedobacter sp. JCM 36344]|uniref:amidohydrolase family protein n=1 Tax=Pedobacter sp. JCM 36344 TaxID=3374280 RepID=UPI0039792169